ncbi:translocation/assembly module TamB domain-containing protein [Sulfitobacter donghicola]|uniref:Translocation and assembly module TamB C-terminal domain-containing protein n=1 Tax=Sulfitobacter donghicola DSW-25 = KCTC 12864 = JCM 14565 TaxID=1300350 RepID=A0A073IKJ3_9RHOB|nr:translocation/assembly module TamB domain-containing protein [Sulfitobacter donghicola]KEJ90065.1 hypothetical protein DSW25_07610 [Sulfitobacter donghicola DSW-25 = KCTC 12864 = JCM 14565]KIN66790.1 DUF490 domain containing protein [Sulfitobacter donghicola DSW-25 = KCTC 12864 = JCM 14565]
MRILRLCLIVLSLLWGHAASAQDEDKSYLTLKIQELLSGAGRQVDIVGFRGALSSQASFDRMTIADDLGVWLTMDDVVLSWNRSALLGGRLVVQELSAQNIDIPRLPASEEATLPDAQATPFTIPQLPDLPVSIDIDALNIAKLRLGAPFMGEQVDLQMNARATLNDDGLDVAFQSARIDGKRGSFDLVATLAREDDILDLLLTLSEQENGLSSNLLDIPGKPSVDLNVKANGPINDLVTELELATDGQERLAGEVSVVTTGDAGDPDRRILADIGGDITAILLPEYRDFFGEDVSLKAEALMQAGGAISVNAFALKAAQMDLQGRVHLNADKWPSIIDVTGTIAHAKGDPVILPGGGGAATVERVELRVDYDAFKGDAYEAQFDISGLETSEGEIAQTTLRSTGTLTGALGGIGQLDGNIQFASQGIALLNTALAEALGAELNGSTQISYLRDQPLRFSQLDLQGADYGLTGNVALDAIASGLPTRLDARLTSSDISRFSALAGQELDGATSLALEGEVGVLSGAFDLDITGTADDIRTGIAQADALMQGHTALQLKAIRNVNGTFLRGLELNNAAMLFSGGAEFYANASRIEADAVLRDIATVLPQYSGRVAINAHATEDDDGWFVDVDGDGPYQSKIRLSGLATGANPAFDFSASAPEVSAFVAGVNGPFAANGQVQQTEQGWMLSTDVSGPYRSAVSLNGAVTPVVDMQFDVSLPDISPLAPQISGPLRAQGQLRQSGEDYSVQAKATGPYSSSGTVAGIVTGPNAKVDFTFGMPNTAAIVPNLNGPLAVQGSAAKAAQGWQVNTDMSGPSGTQGVVAGVVSDDGTLALKVNGTAPLGLAGPFISPRSLQGVARFDLDVNGPAGLDAVSGTIQTSGATLTLPNLRVAFEDVNGDIRLANGRAGLNISANATGGGGLSITGGVGLGDGLPADVNIVLDGVVLVDPRLYRTSISGAMRLSGPISGGAGISGTLNVGETNVTVPSTGLTSIGEIPLIDHVGASSANLATRRRAGLLEESASGDGTQSASQAAGFGLDVLVNAPGRIFVRGRGLDAELGGNLKLSGDTNNILSAGKFELERGRLDILGKRFELEEGSAEFQGDFIPYIRFVTTTTTDAGTASIIVEGPADAPVVSFESTPEGPEDEVLSQLLFGRNLSEISAFQALQLANAVAILAGKGGTDVVGNLRDQFGLDDLNVSTTDSGETAISAGKYLSENVYTDVTAASDGTGEVSLNIDLTPNLKGKATLGSDGNSSIGVFFEKDY